MKKLSAFVWAFLALLFVFFTAGAFTIGSAKNTGDKLSYVTNKTAYYTVGSGGDSLSAVYVNVGAVYTPVGGDTTVTVQYSTSSTSTTSWKTFGTATLANIRSESGESGYNYNWLCVAEGKNISNVRRLAFFADCNLDLNEIVAINNLGDVTTLAVGKNGSAGADFEDSAVLATIDKQESFTTETGLYRTFTEEEGYLMTSVQNVLAGTTVYDGSVYTLDDEYNYLATLLFLPAVAAFGNSVFALRITSFVATCACLVFAYLFVRELLKSDEYAFVFAVCGVVAAVAVGCTATPSALVASAVAASAYFAARFFSKGISSRHILKGGLNVLFSGLFGAVAFALDASALFPIAAVLVLLGLGMRRQYLAYKLALEKAGTDDGENKETEKIKADYDYKDRVCYGFAALSFVAFTFLLALFATVACYPAVLRTYGSNTGFGTAMWLGVKNSFLSQNALAAGGRANALKWLVGVGAGMGWLAKAVCWLGLLGFVCSTVKVALDFAKKTTEKKALRVRRTYFALLAGTLATVVGRLVKGGVPATPELLFAAAWLGFVAIAIAAWFSGKRTDKTE